MSLSIKQLDNEYDFKTKNVKSFYKKNPFPGYRSTDNKFSILQKGNNNIIFKKLKNLFRNKKKILEVGSGTCQLSSFFAIGSTNEVCAFDATYESLDEGRKFSEKNKIKNINFIQGNILQNNFKENYFDLVLANGVLHHTTDPYLGFKNCIYSLKKGGVIVLGLYNSYGRFTTMLLRLVYKIFGKKFAAFLDPVTRNMKIDKNEKEAWIEDQFNHPLEATYTFREINKWFKENNINLISTIPDATKINFLGINEIDLKVKKENYLKKFHLLTEFSMIFNSYGKDGGLFLFIGVKN